MNILALAMPAYATVDPHYFGGATGLDLFAWAAAYVLADGKMRALFTILFGASMAIIADRAEDREPGPAAIHYRRMGWLFVIGMIHAWLFWYGDILVEYAIGGAFAFIAWRWPKSALLYAVLVLLAASLAQDLMSWHDLAALKAAATAPGAGAVVRADWGQVLAFATPDSVKLAHEIAAYRGSFADVFAIRAPMTMYFQSELLPAAISDTLGFMLFGLLLYRSGFLSGAAPAWLYCLLLAGGGVAVLLYLPVVRLILAHDFDPAFLPLADAASLLLRPWLAIAYASGLILLVQSGRMRWLVTRLAAAGRMALSNYLGTTLIATTLFYGYGFGLYGALGRAQLYLVVLAIWGLILLWSRPWLDRFAYGPLEWAWRSLVRLHPQPMRRTVQMNIAN
ncbi:DUF418 domain-containing protein [Flavisphingomonas formosensis]|uniref:DUF418 domain-containing protein n=1 Tax=Flavisphingomonas formosensis TaxID=861534 RepID=UPI0012F767C7|nr:DUF418 domain-containing protein [Sphingomonas formosensis]